MCEYAFMGRDLRTELEAYMRRANKTNVDIASALNVDPITVKRFLDKKTKRPHRIFQISLAELIDSDATTHPVRKAAAG